MGGMPLGSETTPIGLRHRLHFWTGYRRSSWLFGQAGMPVYRLWFYITCIIPSWLFGQARMPVLLPTVVLHYVHHPILAFRTGRNACPTDRGLALRASFAGLTL